MAHKTCCKSNYMSASESPVQRGGLLSLIDTGINISALVENIHCQWGKRPEPNVCSSCWHSQLQPDSDLDKIQKKKKKKNRNTPQTSSIIRAGKHYAAGCWFICVSEKWYLQKKTDVEFFSFQIHTGNSYSLCHVVIIFSKPPSHCFLFINWRAKLSWHCGIKVIDFVNVARHVECPAAVSCPPTYKHS